MGTNKSVILYDNVERHTGVTFAYSASEVSGFEAENAFDWREFSLFRADDGTTLDFTTAAAEDIDCAALWTVARSITGTVLFKLEESAGVFTTKATFTLAAGVDTLKLTAFDTVALPSGRRLRWEFQAGAEVLDIRQLCAGEKMVNPVGQYVGETPPTLNQGVVTTNIIAVNGSIIGRNVRRLEKTDELSWDKLDRDWVRSTWEPFSRHANRYPFFYQWAPVYAPLEVVMAAAQSIQAPRNGDPTPKMEVTMPLLCRGVA